MNIILIGFMASGKSSVGRCISSRMGKHVMEMDAIIEEKAGMTIPEIFESVGEKAFRDLETYVCSLIKSEHNAVVSTGGGCVVRPENRAILRDSGLVVWLKTSPENVLKYASRKNNRPLLVGAGVEKIAAMMADRDPLYEDIAHMTVEVNEMNLQSIYEAIEARLEEEIAAEFAYREA